ncbi:MAG: hypothetical protein Phyf2KO_10960 [Phycisphaerales bacterium]
MLLVDLNGQPVLGEFDLLNELPDPVIADFGLLCIERLAINVIKGYATDEIVEMLGVD